jgi:DNA polymerase III alpha subunit
MTSRRGFLKTAAGASLSAVLPLHILDPQRWKQVTGTEDACLPRTDAENCGLFTQYDQADQGRAIHRITHEEEILRQFGEAADFLAVAELARFAHEEGIPFRLTASGCSSILSYLLGFSDVDPLRHQLFFERFRDAKGRWAPPFLIRVDSPNYERICHLAKLGYGEEIVERAIHFLPAGRLGRIPLLASQWMRDERGVTWQRDATATADETTFRLIRRGDTGGLSLAHLHGLRELLRRLQPGSIEDLTTALALFVLSVHHEDLTGEYLARGDDSSLLREGNPAILEALGQTRGLILYQEQIMMLLDSLAGIAPADGYEFVKAANKRNAAAVAEYGARFLDGATGRGIKPEATARVFREMSRAARYALCKANWVARAIAVYQAAYFKAHHRRQFEKALNEV